MEPYNKARDLIMEKQADGGPLKMYLLHRTARLPYNPYAHKISAYVCNILA